MKIRGNQKTDMPDSLQPSSSSDEPESSNSGDRSNNIDTALDNLETMKAQSDLSDVKLIKDGATSMKDKMSSQFGKLDALLNKAENAQYSMSQQNKQIKGLLKWIDGQSVRETTELAFFTRSLKRETVSSFTFCKTKRLSFNCKTYLVVVASGHIFYELLYLVH